MTSISFFPVSRACALFTIFIFCAVAGVAVTGRAFAAENAEQPSKKPGFWKRLATEGMTIEVGKDGVRTGPGEAKRGSGGSARSGDVYGGDTDEPIHTPLSGKNRFPGIFTGDDVNQARKGFLEWPRVAVTFREFGIHEPCWLVEARIWSSTAKYEDETFRLCTSPIAVTDDLGQTAYVKRDAALMVSTGLEGRSLHLTENSGAQRTNGPLPPLKPFQMNIRVNMQPGGLHASSENIHHRLGSMTTRLAWVSGFIRPSELADASFMGTGSADKRLWIAGFDPKGNKDAAR